MDITKQERIDAANRHISGDKPADICRDVNKSKLWLTKWVNRFKTGEEEWYRSRSRAPKNYGRKTNKEIESAVVNIRKALMGGNEHESKYLGVGTGSRYLDLIHHGKQLIVLDQRTVGRAWAQPNPSIISKTARSACSK